MSLGDLMLKITVNNVEISLSEFPTEIIENTVCGMLKSLRGVEEITSFTINYSSSEKM